MAHVDRNEDSTRKELAQRYNTSPSAITRLANEYWQRWHAYLDTDGKKLLPEQKEEFRAMKRVVRKLDKREAQRIKDRRMLDALISAIS